MLLNDDELEQVSGGGDGQDGDQNSDGSSEGSGEGLDGGNSEIAGLGKKPIIWKWE